MVYEKFPSPSKDKEAESVSTWEAFPTPRVFSLRLNQPKIEVTLIAYQPNLVARQFDLIQIFSKPLYARKKSFLLYNAVHTKATSSRQIARYAGKRNLAHSPSNLTFSAPTNSNNGDMIIMKHNF